MKKIAVLTSGGDAPGMNAAIRAVVRTALHHGVETYGVKRGFAGLVDGDFELLSSRSVSGIIQQAGTILGSSRLPEFKESKVQHRAIKNLNEQKIEGVIIIGGNGSQMGSYAMAQDGFPVIGIASTIDNDLIGSEPTIGVDTAINVALESVDRLKVTAASHRRAIVVEVMGRMCGYIALMTGLASGAEAVLIPEKELSFEEVVARIKRAYQQGKTNALIVVAEGSRHNVQELVESLKPYEDDLGFHIRFTILGHVQRGGAPTQCDRVLATRLGVRAVEMILKNETNILLGQENQKIKVTPLRNVVGREKKLDLELLRMATILDE